MKIWTETLEIEEALKRLGRTKKEVPLEGQMCAMMIYVPEDNADRQMIDCLRAAFRKSMHRKERFFCLVESDRGEVKKMVALIACNNDLSAVHHIERKATVAQT